MESERAADVFEKKGRPGLSETGRRRVEQELGNSIRLSS